MLKDELLHFVLSTVVGVLVAYIFGSWWAVPLALASGFFIDLDHLIDYFIFSKGRFSLEEFKIGTYFDDSGKVYVFAHGFEYAIVLIILGILLPSFAWIFFSLGFSNLLHLLYDTVFNKPIWPTYFISFRLAKNFDHQIFKFPKCQK